MRQIAILVLSFFVSTVEVSLAEGTVPSGLAEIKLSFAPVVRETAPAVVNIYASRVVAERVSPFANDPFFSQFFGGFDRTVPRVQNSLGSGVILSADGIVASNYHVVGNATDIRIVLSDRREFSGEILLSDQESDLAIIRLEGAEDLPALEFGDSDLVEVGDLVLAIGNPFGVGQTVTSGIVSGLARSGVNVGSQAGYFIQTDAPINPGNSGGALVDMAGRLVGLNTSILTRSGGSNGIGFAIPAKIVEQYVRQASAGRREFARAWSGLSVQPVDSSLAAALGQSVPSGVLITEAHAASVFAAAGLQAGDVFLSIDGLPVNAAAELDFRLATRSLGSRAEVVFLRGDREHRAVVLIDEAPDIPRSEPHVVSAGPPFTDLVVATVNPKLISDLDLPLSATGVIVVNTGGYSSRIGLRPGDTILRVNGTEIGDPAELEQILSTDATVWEIEVQREGRMLRIRLQV